MTELEKYQKVNECETFGELALAIESFADETGTIQGRSRKFDAKMMAHYCINFKEYPPNALTREYGIRQQAMYIDYYTK
jgi:hypothetical protein